ncbi:unnamed protein product [Lymnaea stagnalis]|uniref:Lengsin n=1 Tax=Lymnaea stagnalis TaxID=6523 RepID=A0AAV2IFK4_LYMST
MAVQNGDKSSCQLEDYDLVLLTACDIHGVARGRFIFKRSVQGFVRNGLGMTQASLFSGIMCDIPLNLTAYAKEGWSNGTLIPDTDTLRPLSWLSYGGKKVGHLLCDLLSSKGEPEVAMPRTVAVSQLKALNDIGYDISVSLQLEFVILKKDSIIPISLHEDISQLNNTLLRALHDSGVPVVSIGKGAEPGKLQISLDSLQGIEVADCVHRLRNMLKSLCGNAGYDITYMTKPLPTVSSNGSTYIYTLIDKEGRNVFASSKNKNELSELGQQWVAGSLKHQAAVTGLLRPTLNCYTGEADEQDLNISWTSESSNRKARLKLDLTNDGPQIADALPTSASNPYIVLGAIVAAGMDGLVTKLSLPVELSDSPSAEKGPSSLLESLSVLEKDTVFKSGIFSKFVERFILLKKEFEIGRLEKKNDSEDNFTFERSIYLKYL